MSRNKLKREKTHKSILAQFFILLVGLGLLCGALFLVLHTTVGSALESYVYSSDFLSNVTEKRVNDLQEYVTENQVSATDSQALSQWMRGKPLTLMEIYRSNVLVYSSYASYSLAVEGGDFTWTATEGEETPTYDWISYYTVDFADGEGEVVLYSNELYRYSTYATMVEIILCAALFLLGFLIAFQRTVSYMRQISLEIQAMEGGDLNRPITVRGDNDLTALAESLDAMRLAFRAQQEREASTYAANQALISQMSHDLRTPLTTLLIYTEILRYGKYQGEEQLRGYLDKIDGKAQQIKQLAENLLEYSLASQKRRTVCSASTRWRPTWARPRLPTRRPSARRWIRTPSMPASPAVRASTATSRSTWSPTSPARATSSSTTSWAAPSPRSISLRWTPVSRVPCRPACWPAIPWRT